MSAIRRVTAFSALRRRDFRVFWIGFLTSMSGSWMQVFAVGWLVVQLAEREGAPERAALYLGLVGFSRVVPGLVVGLVAGAVVDRADRRAVLVVEETCSLAVAVVLALLTISGEINLGWVMLLSVIGATATSFEVLTRQAILPGLAGPDLLVSAVGLNGAAVNLSALLGPLIGGLLLGPLGIGGLMLVNASTFLVALVALALIPAQPSPATGPSPGMLASIGEGLSFVRETPFVRWQLLLFTTGVVLGTPYQELLPAFVNDTLHAGSLELSWLAAAASVGGLAATVVAASPRAVRRRGRAFILSSLAAGVVLFLFGAQRSVALSLVLMVAVGFTNISVAVLSMMITQLTTPGHLRARVISVQVLLVNAGGPLGALMLGALGTAIGIHVALAAGGAALALVSIFVLARAPALRRAASAPRADTVAVLDPSLQPAGVNR